MAKPASSTDLFAALRPRLFGIAYRMLGVRADAEDVLQDAWLRWNAADRTQLQSAEAWLVTVVTRLSIDRLRAAKAEREAYVGWWLPEPIVEMDERTPETAAELASDLSLAFLYLLERLAPEERAAFLLRQVFDYDYDEIAAILEKSEAIRALLADNAEAIGDGGGKVPTSPRGFHGGDRVANLYWANWLKAGDRLAWRIATINGEPGLLRYVDGRLESAQAIVTDGERIVSIYVVRNPDKLARIAPAL